MTGLKWTLSLLKRAFSWVQDETQELSCSDMSKEGKDGADLSSIQKRLWTATACDVQDTRSSAQDWRSGLERILLEAWYGDGPSVPFSLYDEDCD